MELYVARQPVFDQSKNIVGYELLHRESHVENEFTERNGEYASSRVITGAFLTLGLNSLTSGKLAFINFTEELLTSGVAQLLPKDQLVVEILESVAPTKKVITACEHLKELGYTLALDDYMLDPLFQPLTKIADIIKVDFRQIDLADRRRAIQENRRDWLKFLAEKVETQDEFLHAIDLGYSMFQGFFFSKPVILSASTIPAGKLGYLKLMQAINGENPDFQLITEAIQSDLTLSLETVKLCNSAAYGRRQKISSIKQAVVKLGLEGIRKWIYLSSLRKLGAGKPDILVSTSIIRSRFMENLSAAMGEERLRSEYSMLGLFSLLDALMNCSFETLLGSLYISDEIKGILTGQMDDSPLCRAYRILLYYERGDWENTTAQAMLAGLDLNAIAEAYIASIKWYNDFSNMYVA